MPPLTSPLVIIRLPEFSFTPMYKRFPFFVLLFFSIFIFYLPLFFCLPDPEPEAIQPFLVSPSPPATIPAFPEQSNVAGCPLELTEELFHGINAACGGGSKEELHRSRCCPVLAAWLYAAYSDTGLGRAKTMAPGSANRTSPSAYEMPLLPDDSETCVDGLGKAFKERGLELRKPNETCDLVYCYCGIRLHPLNCHEAFSVNEEGKLVGDKNVRKLEKDCLSNSKNVNGFPGLGGCNKCLTTLHLLNKKHDSSSNGSKSKSEDIRSTKMHNKDCQLMGLTWLLFKNRTAYIRTVSAMIRAMMMSTDGSDPQSCTLNSDGMPLAVDSYDISNRSSSMALPIPMYQSSIVINCLVFLLLIVSSSSHF